MAVSRGLVPLLVLLGLACAGAAVAESYFDTGKKLFGAKQFAKALPYLHKAVEDAPWDSTAAYYEALDYQYMKDWKNCIKCYKGIVDRFPGTPAYNNSIAVLRSLDPGYVRTREAKEKNGGGGSAATGADSGGTASAGDDGKESLDALLADVQISAPQQEQRIPVVRQTEKIWIDGSINGHNIKFDFNADETTVSPKDAATWMLKDKKGGPAKAGNHAIATVRVGQISESNFPVLVENTETPKLGADFFNKFSYRLEPNNLIATRKGGGNSAWDVPFRKQGKDLVVDVVCNGRRVSMVLDTEGGETIVPKARAREFGLEVSENSQMNGYNPDTNPNAPLRGEAGFGEIKTNSSAEAKLVLGPVSTSVHVKVDENAKDARLSGGALGGWKLNVDSAAKVIHFTR